MPDPVQISQTLDRITYRRPVHPAVVERRRRNVPYRPQENQSRSASRVVAQ